MFRLLLPTLIVCTAPAFAEVPKVATDIAPVQGLVAAVLGDLGEPARVVPRGASPHDHALRPSEARQMQNADLVVWIGPDLMPNLVKPLSTLASGARILTLADLPGTHLLENRTEAIFPRAHDPAGQAHGQNEAQADSHEDAEGHEHDDATEHEHDQMHDHSEGHDHADGHDHSAAAHDPHVWLDPDNALLWLDAIAAQLSELDPDNAAAYGANADSAKAGISEAVTQAQGRLEPVHDAPYLSLHDAYQYFEAAFDLHPFGAVALSDASAPGPARLDELRDALAQHGVSCVLAEPGAARGFLTALGETQALKVVEVDPLGGQIPEGAGYYARLITETADKIADCLTPAS